MRGSAMRNPTNKIKIQGTLISVIRNGEIRASREREGSYGYYIEYQLTPQSLNTCFFAEDATGKITESSNDGANVLMEALKYQCSHEVISFLLEQKKLEQGVTINQLNRYRQNIFHYAAICCQKPETINLLIDHYGKEKSKKSLQQKDFYDNTPAELAIIYGNKEAVSAFSKIGFEYKGEHLQNNGQARKSLEPNQTFPDKKVAALLVYMLERNKRDGDYSKWFGCAFGWLTSYVFGFNFSKQQKITAASKKLCFWLDSDLAPTLTPTEIKAMQNGRLKAARAA